MTNNDIYRDTTTRTAEQITADIIAWLTENEDEYNDAIEELDGYNGYLNDSRYYPMECINEFYSDTDPLDVLYRAFYGYDEETWHTDAHGQREYGAFNPNRDYFTFNGYGNFVSSDYKDYSAFLDKWLVEALADNLAEITAFDGLTEINDLFDELYEATHGDDE